IEATSDKDLQVKAAATSALGRMTVEGDQAAQALLRCLDDVEADIRERAAMALANLGESAYSVGSQLLERLVEFNSADQARIAEALGKIGGWDPRVISTLITLLDDAHTCHGAIRGLLFSQGHAKPATNAMIAILKSRNDDSAKGVTRIEAVMLLGSIGP